MSKTVSRSKHKLATLLTNSIFLTIVFLTMVMLVQNYQVNQQVVEQEVARSKQQTQSLVQENFNYRLSALEIQQDSYSLNDGLFEAVARNDADAVIRIFDGIDQRTASLAPDFRFVASRDQVVWADYNFQFYGITQAQIQHLHDQTVASRAWRLEQLPTPLGVRYVLLRRTAIVNLDTGEVFGHAYIAVVLNDNFSWGNSILKASNANDLMFVVGSDIIASSTKNSDLRHIDWLAAASKSFNASEFTVSKTDLTINESPTYLSVYTIQSNEHIMLFVKTRYIWMIVIAVLIVTITVSTRYWIGRRLSSELQTLMDYTESTSESMTLEPFPGSTIKEFDHIGHAFQSSFQRIRQQEKQFTDLFNFSLSPIMLWDVNGELIRMNPSAERAFRESSRASEGGASMVECLTPHIRMCAKGATLTGINTTIGTKTYRWNLSPIHVDNTELQIMAQGQDVTSLIEAEEQSKRAREEALESARMRADFLAKMSHELRTPLNGILGVSQLLKHKLKEPSNIEKVDVLCNSGEHLLAVLDDILDFSKIERGKFNIERIDFKLSELTSAVDNIFRPLCQEKGIGFVVESNISDQVWAHSDQVRLNQILFNLASNAVKFTHHGQVTVRIHLVGDEDEQLLEIFVEDTGIGIDGERLKHIFEPFVQAESTTTREYGGSGLGLAIVHSLVEMLDGTADIESTKGEGTIFSVQLPIHTKIADEKQAQSGLQFDPKTLFDRVLSVLLVEDNHTNAFIAKAFCEKYGMEVTWVKDGYNALELLQAQAFDLVLMDNQLPNLGGIETTARIRSELQLTVPVFACTADGMEDTRRAFEQAGANYVIVKPIKESAFNVAFHYFKQHFYT